MQSSYDPQLPVASTPATSVAPATQSVVGAVAAPAKRPGRFLVFRKAMRLLLRRWLYTMTLLFRWVRPFAGFAAVIVVLLIAMSWMAVQLWWPSSAPAQDVRVASLPPAPSVEDFLLGQQSFNADLMWQAYSPRYQAAALQRGATKDMLQMQADAQRQGGLRYVRSEYIGGVKMDDGRSMYFYTIDLAQDTARAKMPFIFTADPDGKIIEIDSPFLRPQSGAQ
jgi:hypothetical protein